MGEKDRHYHADHIRIGFSDQQCCVTKTPPNAAIASIHTLPGCQDFALLYDRTDQNRS